ncbi:PAS/PAC sensor hybrid histidine kinase [Tolypothrix sp. NIES-4075]|uniref:PAS domain-containing sensor histidine kinase n=1 Tax=Tolypothrix sp. NIES-4075 TaxID=2005459 RepID=UPI000B5C785B|nr:PAS domain-containing sensor histidine kinase [Tolypothrix sp. NIES-4075]GAX41209.1 PAS/PAC sensor hybrid histidine kinase [Tolypothrix sp. NIES-4075]
MLDAEKFQNQLADNLLSLHQQINKQANYSMVATVEEGMVLQLADGTIQAGNTACERILGLSAEQLIGHTSVDHPWQSIHEDGSPFPGETHPAMVALQTGKPCLNVVMGLYKPNGQLVWLLLNSQPLFLAGVTKPYAVVTTFSEIKKSAGSRLETEYQAASISEQDREIALRHNEQFELAAVNCLFYDWEISRGTVERTQGLTALLGYTQQEASPTQQWWLRIVHPDDLQRVDEEFKISLANGDRYKIEYRVRHKDGRYVWLQDRGFVERDGDNRTVRIVGIGIDISDRKKTEADLQQSEERIRLATTAANLGMWFWDLTINELIWTSKCKELFGFPPDTTITYDLFRDRLHPEDRERTDEAVSSAVAQKLDYDIEYRAVWTDNSVHWLAAKGRAFYNGDGQPVRMMGTVQDISERKQAEETLRQSEERYRFLADTIPEMVWTTDAEGETTYVNQRWEEYTGLNLEETAAYGWRKVLHPDDLEISAQLWTEALSNGTPYEAEHRYLRVADGTYRWHLVRGLPIKDDQGRIVKWFGTCTDIHQQKQIDEERAQILEREKAARLEAEAANRIKDEFLAVLSHELRSPLNPILGWAKLLKSRKFDDAATFRALDTIERNAKLQIQLIDDLLDVSRILRGKLCLNFAAFDLAVVINAAIETVKLAAQDKSIEMHLQIEPNVGKVLCDFNRLQQVVGNLLNNAVKFTPAGGRIDIRLSVGRGQGGAGSREQGAGSRGSLSSHLPPLPLSPSPTPPLSPTTTYAEITVTDTGKGISSEFLPHVFEYFRQADSSTTRNHGGLGLGLSIVRHLIELHGGTVTAESPGEGKGATFIVRLPLIEESSKQEKENKTEAENTNSLPLAGIRILLVDDEIDTRDFMSFLLQQQGATVSEASSASEALKAFAESTPDILLSDLGMPLVDGYSLISQIRSMSPEQGGEIPAIALSAYAGESDRDRAFAAGFQKHLAKPVEPTELLALIIDLLGQR